MSSKTNKPKDSIFFILNQYPEVIVAIIVTIGLSVLISQYNLAGTHDGLAHLTWQYFWDQQFLQGNFFPKWNEGAFGGLGSPSFIFYPPLARTIGFPFSILNLSIFQQLRLVYIIIVILNAIGVITISRMLFDHKLAKSLSVFLGTFNPFLIICILKRGAIAESLAIALIAWIMAGIYLVLSSNTKLNFLLLTIAFSALFITHIPSSVTLGSSYIISIAILFVFRKISFYKTLLLVVIPIISGLIDASFVFPLLFDVDLIQSVGSPPYKNKFLLFINLAKLPFSAFSLSQEGWENSLFNSFLVSLLILALTIILTRPWRIENRKNLLMTQQIIMVSFSLFMMTNLSVWVYQTISVFEHIQFPWRFLTVSSSISPYLFGFSIEKLLQKNLSSIRKFIMIIIITIILMLTYKSAKLYGLNFANGKIIDSLLTYNEKISPQIVHELKYQKINDNFYLLHINARGQLYMTADQYLFYNDVSWSLPATVSKFNWVDVQVGERNYRNELPPRLYPKIELIQGKGEVLIESWKPSFRQLKVDNKSDILLNLKTFYYPGWKMQIISSVPEKSLKSRLYAAPDGRMQLRLPSGIYTVKIWYEGTLAERLGIVVSIISLFLLGLFMIKKEENEEAV